MTFDRFDICEAYDQYSYDYHVSGYATGRREHYWGETNSDIQVRLHRMRFRPSPLRTYHAEDLSENARDIYDALVARKERA